jgi:hypothetical protein
MSGDEFQFDILISDILEGKRKVPAETRNDLMFTMMARLYQEQHKINDRIKRVEDHSILLLIIGHPWMTLVISLLCMSLLVIWSTPELREPFAQAIGLSKDVMP